LVVVVVVKDLPVEARESLFSGLRNLCPVQSRFVLAEEDLGPVAVTVNPEVTLFSMI
jgi:hypothetical protein